MQGSSGNCEWCFCVQPPEGSTSCALNPQIMGLATRLLRLMHTYEQVVKFTLATCQLVGAQAGSGVPSTAGASVATSAGAALIALASLLSGSVASKGDIAREITPAAGAARCLPCA